MNFPITLNPTVTGGGPGSRRTIYLHGSVTVIIGPNGAGKTQLLRALKEVLAPHAAGKRVRYLSAGRAWHLEQYRSDYDGHRAGRPNYENANYGGVNDSSRRHNYETLQGDFQTLALRPDILIKVRERLRKLFARDLNIRWDAGNLKIEFLRANVAGGPYSSAREASGLLHLVGLLSAVYDDEVGVLLIDEPEVSLHPQLQSFLLREIESVAAAPSQNTNKKLVILATHSTEFVRIESPDQLPHLVFCYDPDDQPVQVDPQAGELKSRKIFSLIARMGQEHKLCFFSATPLLIEGPSDAIICNALANRLDINLEAGGAQMLPVIGKGQISVVNKLFRLLGKRPLILADADALTDGLDLANEFLQGEEATRAASRMGFGSGPELSRAVFSAFCDLVDKRWAEISTLAETSWYWVNRDPTESDLQKIQRRSALSTLFSTPDKTLENLSKDLAWLSIKERLKALLDLLEVQGLFILRRGTIESYYAFVSASAAEKPTVAAEEAACLRTAKLGDIESAYDDILRFLRRAATTATISEAEVLQDMLLAVAAPALARSGTGISDEALRTLMSGTLGKQADLFEIKIIDQGLVISLRSNILDVSGFPLTVLRGDDLFRAVAEGLNLSKTSGGKSGANAS